MKSLSSIKKISIGKQYFFSTIILFGFIVLLYTVQNSIGYETVSMILLLIIFLLPLFNFSKGPIILSAVISALAWDYYFIPPHFTMYIAKTEDVVMLFMFFIVAATNGILAAKVYKQKDEMILRERRLYALLDLVRESAKANNINELMNNILPEVRKTFDAEIIFFIPVSKEQLGRLTFPRGTVVEDEIEWLAAEASFKMKIPTGRTTDTVSNAEAVYFPVTDKNEEVRYILSVKESHETNQDNDEMDFLKEYIEEIKMFLLKEQVYSRP
jgi:two-component system, OmpR family, sensor histidine kinase KdpD